MTWRKQYTSYVKKKRDQRIGFIACLLINLLIGISAVTLTGRLDSTILALAPWIVNLAILAWAFIFRPHIAIGYLMLAAMVIIASMALGIVFLAACFAGLAVTVILNPLEGLAVTLGLGCVFPALLLVGLGYFAYYAFPFLSNWWSYEEEF